MSKKQQHREESRRWRWNYKRLELRKITLEKSALEWSAEGKCISPHRRRLFSLSCTHFSVLFRLRCSECEVSKVCMRVCIRNIAMFLEFCRVFSTLFFQIKLNLMMAMAKSEKKKVAWGRGKVNALYEVWNYRTFFFVAVMLRALFFRRGE